jgi:hypothetical protein
MKRSCSGNVALMGAHQDRRMQIERRPADDLLDVVRVLLLVQGAILIATTIEAAVWGVAFSGAPGVPMLMSGAAAAIVLIARLRITVSGRPTARRLVYAVECVVLVTFVLESALAIALAGALPPVAAVLTQLALPLSVVTLLRRSRSARRAMRPQTHALEGVQ